jgi:hypothetical protein
MNDKLRSVIYSLVKEEFSLLEKKKKEEEDINLDLSAEEAPVDEEPLDLPPSDPAMDMDMGMESGTSAEKRVGQGLQMALDAAKEMQDGETKDKLIRQIGNTALFFLKTQIPTGGAQV